MTARQWLDRFASEIGAEAPSSAEVDAILALAAEAAHASERIAAPVACWMAGRAGRPLGDLIGAAEGMRGG